MNLESVVIILIVVVLGILFYIANKITIKESEKNIYVYPKTGNQYKVIYRCKMKLPIERTWIDAMIYIGLKDGNFYVRERKDFFDKFVKLNDWKNGNSNK